MRHAPLRQSRTSLLGDAKGERISGPDRHIAVERDFENRLAFGALGFLYALVTLVQFLLYRSFPSGWTTIIILISIFSGTQLVFLGILGEYLAAIFDEVYR